MDNYPYRCKVFLCCGFFDDAATAKNIQRRYTILRREQRSDDQSYIDLDIGIPGAAE